MPVSITRHNFARVISSIREFQNSGKREAVFYQKRTLEKGKENDNARYQFR